MHRSIRQRIVITRSARIGVCVAVSTALIALVAGCAGGSKTSDAPVTSTSATTATTSTARPAAGTPTTTTTAARTLTNCELLSPAELRSTFGVPLRSSVQPQTNICRYEASDVASGGLGVSVDFVGPRGKAYFESLERAYTRVPASATSVQPGEVWSAPSLVANLGGDDGFFALDPGGAYTWAARSGDVCVVIQIGGNTWVHSSAGAHINADVFELMKLALPRAVTHTPAPAS